jgi:hypothetical protein
MKQIDLIEYLLAYGCEIAKHLKNGGCIISNKQNNTSSQVPFPSNGKLLKMSTVCIVCKNLGVKIPDCAKDSEGMIDFILSKHTEKNNEESQ